ncbi:hypothetical protein ACQKJZ_09935 [Sphingomonas sp. NPDC019816]|uniref:hypothetical protein n=1 Tax=Sphingomonas sp. NPDC019816 TaxID=3390679 RepID=UPI003D014BEF
MRSAILVKPAMRLGCPAAQPKRGIDHDDVFARLSGAPALLRIRHIADGDTDLRSGLSIV